MKPSPIVRDPGTTLTGIDIPFGDMVVFFVKAGIAAIPAMVVIGLLLRALMSIVPNPLDVTP